MYIISKYSTYEEMYKNTLPKDLIVFDTMEQVRAMTREIKGKLGLPLYVYEFELTKNYIIHN